MIKFFRKIRQKLLNQGKTSKYFKYAIGEIVLVVIGILIALQINNWNENRKQDTDVKTYLKSLNEEINTNIKIIESISNSSVKMHKVANYYQRKFISENPEKIKDTAITNFILKINPMRSFKPSKAVLNDLISSGNINYIENSKLKNKILLLESVYISFEEILEESDNRYLKDIESYLNVNSDYSELAEEIYSINKTTVKKGNFKHVRTAFLNNRILSNSLLFYQAMLQTIEQKSIKQIKYLKKLQEEITKVQ